MESADKPGSVESNHSSGTTVTGGLKQPTRKHLRARLLQSNVLPYLVLLQVGFTMPRSVTTRAVRSYRTISPLPHALQVGARRYIFCGTFRRLAPPRCYLAPCPPEPGLSSRCEHRAIAWPTPRPTIGMPGLECKACLAYSGFCAPASRATHCRPTSLRSA